MRISADGCRTLESGEPQDRTLHVTLACAPPVIGKVSVATGSSESLHRLPVAASVLDHTAIADSPALFSDELLRAMPGFDRDRSNSAFTNYGQLRVSFAGAGADRGLVLADGIPAQDGFGGQIDWAAYPVSDLSRVELLRGAGSALYGAGAIGGVLQIETFAPPSLRAERGGTLGFMAGSHSFAHAYARAGTQIGAHLAASLALDREQLSYADLPPAYASPIDRPARTSDAMESLRLRYQPNEAAIVDLGYRAAFDYQQEGRPNYDFWRRLSQEHVRVRLPNRSALIDINGYVRNAYVTNRADIYPQKPGALRYTQDVPTSERGASIAWTIDHPAATFEARADARSIYGDSLQYAGNGAFQSGGSGNQQLAGIALQQTVRLHRTEIVAGARVDEVGFANGSTTNARGTTAAAARIDRALSPRLGVRYDLGSHLAARASAGGGFRAPYLNELVRGYQIGSVVYEPNPSLLPERSASRSIGLDYVDATRHISLDYTQTGVSDAIMFRTIDATHQMRSNVDRTQTNGVTLAFEQSLGVCTRMSGSLTDQYARIVGGNAAIVGKRLQYVPALEGTLGIDEMLGSIQTGLSVAYLGQTYADDLNLRPLGSAVVAGIHAAAPIGHGARVIAGIENLTDAHYLSSIDRYGIPTVLSVGIELPLAHAPTAPLPARCGR
ncbi:MAG: TonB-dependent receptor [Vulcanimicrobiaceae bacterium]